MAGVSIEVVGQTVVDGDYVYGKDSTGLWGRKLKGFPHLDFEMISERDVPDSVHLKFSTVSVARP